MLQRIRAVFSLHSKMSTKSGARKADPVSSDGDAPSQAKVQRIDAAQGPADGVEETIESMVGSMKNKSNIELTADGNLKLGLLIKAACAAVATGSDLKEAGVSGGLTVGHICPTVSPSHRLTVAISNKLHPRRPPLNSTGSRPCGTSTGSWCSSTTPRTTASSSPGS